MSNKKIWILNHYATNSFYNKGGRHYWFAVNLIERGYEPTIFCANTRHNSDDFITITNCKYVVKETEGIPYVFVKTADYKGNGFQRVKNMVGFYKNLFPAAKEYEGTYGKPDVIIASSVHPLTWLAGYRQAKRYKSKFVAETRDLWPETLVTMGQIKRNSIPARLLYKLENFIYKKADKLVFTFPGGKDYLESIGLDVSKARYINNGVDLEEFNYNKVSYVFEDSDLEHNNIFRIIYAGAMGKANALNYLVEAAKIIQDNGIRDIQFILFGSGYQKQDLVEYVKQNDINSVVFKERVEKRYIPGILDKASINVFTGENIELYKYGLSLNKMFDYFASGKPTVSNINCGYDIIRNYNCGITVEGGSAKALAEGILKFYNMPKEEYDTYCNNALKAAKDFDFKVLTDKLEEVIQGC